MGTKLKMMSCLAAKKLHTRIKNGPRHQKLKAYIGLLYKHNNLRLNYVKATIFEGITSKLLFSSLRTAKLVAKKEIFFKKCTFWLLVSFVYFA